MNRHRMTVVPENKGKRIFLIIVVLLLLMFLFNAFFMTDCNNVSYIENELEKKYGVPFEYVGKEVRNSSDSGEYEVYCFYPKGRNDLKVSANAGGGFITSMAVPLEYRKWFTDDFENAIVNFVLEEKGYTFIDLTAMSTDEAADLIYDVQEIVDAEFIRYNINWNGKEYGQNYDLTLNVFDGEHHYEVIFSTHTIKSIKSKLEHLYYDGIHLD